MVEAFLRAGKKPIQLSRQFNACVFVQVRAHPTTVRPSPGPRFYHHSPRGKATRSRASARPTLPNPRKQRP
jgi:hypothetical protein